MNKKYFVLLLIGICLIGFVLFVFAAPVTLSSVVLNSTSIHNFTTENLTAYSQGLSADTNVFYNWKVEGNSIKRLEMPMDGGKLCAGGTTVCDYIGWNNATPGSGAEIEYDPIAGYGGTGVYVFNDDDYLNINPDISFTSDFSISTWVKRSATGTNNDFYFSSAEDNVIRRHLHLGFRDSNVFAFGFYGGDDLDTVGTYTSTTDWYFITVTYDWTTRNRTIYFDGDFVASDIATGQLDLDAPTETLIGALSPISSDHFRGYIDDFVIWDLTLTPEQISALYNNRTDLIVSQETVKGQNWSVCATPNNNTANGNEVCSSEIFIQSVSNIDLN